MKIIIIISISSSSSSSSSSYRASEASEILLVVDNAKSGICYMGMDGTYAP